MMKNLTEHKHYKMGQAPYRYIGLWSAPSKSLLEANPMAYNSMMANRPKCSHLCCAHCSTGILHHFMIADAKGIEFSVGSECIAKLKQHDLVTQAQSDQKKMEKTKRLKLKQLLQEKRDIAREEKLQAQRDENGGLTDNELKQKKEKANQLKHEKKRSTIAQYFNEQLDDSDFSASVLKSIIKHGQMPYGRAPAIMCSIVAKNAGRTNSKAYNLKLVEAEREMNKLEKALSKLNK
ncbi:MAG: hypothetical protein HAW67_01265 [Endozoicomonadaceae bacterium]|nr:hypothetical protein [Endozoicomonadaceae bacterium]